MVLAGLGGEPLAQFCREHRVEVVRDLRRQQVAVYGCFDNHFAGHAPASVELFRELYES